MVNNIPSTTFSIWSKHPLTTITGSIDAKLWHMMLLWPFDSAFLHTSTRHVLSGMSPYCTVLSLRLTTGMFGQMKSHSVESSTESSLEVHFPTFWLTTSQSILQCLLHWAANLCTYPSNVFKPFLRCKNSYSESRTNLHRDLNIFLTGTTFVGGSMPRI